jgi:putative Mg2+ transporter-C (MgtC) family protein
MGEIEPLSDAGGALVRLGLATVIGGAIGLNRDLHHKPAGLRTHALVALGSALAIYISIQMTASGKIADLGSVTRVIQGVLTGIGFLGAGVIFREDGGKSIKGLTTAASIWLVACLGMACGAGRWSSVGVGFGITLAVLIYGGPLEKTLHRLIYRDDAGGPAGSGAGEERSPRARSPEKADD